MKRILPLIITLIASLSYGQQDVQFTHYMYNMNVVNPAYTTDGFGSLSLGLLHRQQWVGIEGAPNSTNLFGNYVINDRIELGATIINDNIGDVIQENIFNVDFSYKLPIDRWRYLSLGLKTGINLFDVNFDNFNLQSGSTLTDPNFIQNVKEVYPVIGAGAYYNTNRFYIGFSVPNLIKSAYFSRENGRFTGTEELHYFLTSGYVFDLSSDFRLKPSFLIKAVKGAPIIFDINTNLLYRDILEFGLGYRNQDAIAALINFRISKSIRLGYAYDYTITDLNDFNTGSHEFLLLFNLNTLKDGYNKSPRFF